MSLEEYRRKRSFDQTPEPTADSGEGGERGPRFCLQWHRAGRLHYDLRLEADGVLKSWAVPKGPSLTPLDKRLAVHTEDHPLGYLEWEGVIPEGQYGAGVMMVFDSGGYQLLDEGDFQEQYRRGDIKFELRGRKVRGAFALIRTGKGQWLLLKKKDEHCDPEWDPESHLWSVVSGCTPQELKAGRRYPGPHLLQAPEGAQAREQPATLEPMLAQGGEPFDHPDWVFEMKWDGFRCLAFCQGEVLRLCSRRGNSLTRQFPELSRLRSLVQGESFVIDGELVVLDDRGVPDFQRLAPRMHSSKDLSWRDPAVYYVFDLLFLDGYDLRHLTFDRRRQLLSQVLRTDNTVRLSEALPENGKKFFAWVEQQGLEGLVAKRRASLYHCGRSEDWLKVKVEQTEDAVVVGFSAPKGGRIEFGSLVLARYQDQKLVHIGNVGSGFNQRLLKEFGDLLRPLARETSPLDPVPKLDDPVTWVEPKLVVEVRFSSWSNDGIIRFPVFSRLREDKAPEECRSRDELAEQSLRRGQEQQRVSYSNRHKILFPRDGVTKGDLIDYYDAVAPFILPHLIQRPLSLKRYPHGIDKKFFFQKHPGAGFPPWISTVILAGKEHILCNDRQTLLYLANLACIDQNPALSRIGSLDQPDYVVFDLDPSAADFTRVREAARVVSRFLEELGARPAAKTSGSRGIHLFVSLAPGHSFEQSRLFAQVVAQGLIRLHPELFSIDRNPKKRRAGSVYIDTPQNRQGATLASVYSVRAVDGALVSAALSGDELFQDFQLEDFTLKSMPERLQKVGDAFQAILSESSEIRTLLPQLEEILR